MKREFSPGVYYGIPNEEYHASAGVSNSGLHDLAQSPLHYYARHEDPKRPEREEKPGQREGTLAHCLILEPEAFYDRYAVGPEVNTRNSKAWHAFEDSNPGKVCIKRSEYEAALGQRESVLSIPDVKDLLSDFVAESSAYWIDPITGELCRCRPDVAHPVGDKSVILADLKTCSDASPDEFRRQVARKGYHIQDAFYTDGYALASSRRVLGFLFIAVEAEYPYAASACMVDDEGRDKGRLEYRRLLDIYHRCRVSNNWPGYSEAIETISLPAWAA